MLSRYNTPDAKEGFFFIAIGGVAFALALGYHMPGSIALSPAAFPIIVSAVLAFLGLRLVMRVPKDGGKTLTKSEFMSRLGVVAMIFALCLAYAFAMQIVGFIISTMVYLFVFLLMLGERRKSMIVLVPVVTSLGVYFFFEKALSVMLP